MRLLRDPSPLAILVALLLATGLNLLAAGSLAGLARGLAIALLGAAKAGLIVYGFMRLQRESTALSGALVAYACILAALAGLRIALSG
jgi:cytochrome c oxidase subunit IV